jgi:DNA-binding NarL/FixJ family response regulator
VEAAGQRPLRAIVDHDEAVASLRLDPGERARPAALWEAAASAFAGLGMTEWAARASGERAALLGATGQVLPAGLSEREAEVLRLVARGQSDRQIADALFVSPRTVNAHVRNLLMKTERGNRTELSVWAVEHGLVESGNR